MQTVPFFLKIKTKISQTRHVVDSKSNLNSQGQVMTKHYASLPEFLSIKNIKTINASTNHLHPHVCIHYHTPNIKPQPIITFGECQQLQTHVGGTFSLLEENLLKKKVCLALTNSMIQAFFNWTTCFWDFIRKSALKLQSILFFNVSSNKELNKTVILWY